MMKYQKTHIFVKKKFSRNVLRIICYLEGSKLFLIPKLAQQFTGCVHKLQLAMTAMHVIKCYGHSAVFALHLVFFSLRFLC